MNKAVVLLAHGARNPRWAQPFEELVVAIEATQPSQTARLAFLEFLEPSLPSACARLALEGHTSIAVIPCFFGGAGHVLRDLPALVDEVRRQHPSLQLRLHQPLGELPALRQALVGICLDLLKETAS